MKIFNCKNRLSACIILMVLTVFITGGCSSGNTVSIQEQTTVKIGSLKGPTSMGLLFLKDQADEAEYTFRMAASVDELLPLMVKGDLDIAIISANVAAILYQKMEGQVKVIDINNLGVLYMVSVDDSIRSPEDLKGKTIYLTGKGTTPDYILNYILRSNGINESDYTLEYKSEATEAAALLADNPDAVGLLPQPFVTVACSQNEGMHIVMDMNEQWELLQTGNGSSMVTGVTVVRTAFFEENEDAVRAFMEEHKKSTEYINENMVKGAELCVAEGIVGSEAMALKAIPECNITYIDGEDMKTALSGYLEVLYEQDPESVGGSLPGDDFYYIP